jgi:hypothetical protein
MKKNKWWIRDYEYLVWWIEIPCPQSMNGILKILKLYRDIEKLCYEYKIYMIDEIEGIFKKTNNFYYVDWIEKQLNQRQVLESLGAGSYVGISGNPEDFPTQTILTELCFYNKHGELQKKQVNNIRTILQETVTNECLEDWEIDKDIFDPNIRTLDISAINISGDSLRINDILNNDNTREKINIFMSCETNIWFPWIPDNKGNPYDNRELAYCHTPRLNKFLSGVRKLVLDCGGTFEVECQYSFYNEQICENGIILN